MTDEESLHAAINEAVALQPYDTSWPAMFVAERDRLLYLFPNKFLDIQHIGSTAVSGLPAKPIIDILAGVESMATAEFLAQPLCLSGYTTSAEFNKSLSDRKWFMRWANGLRTHHLHLVVYGSAIWQERLKFRNVLRSSPRVATQYAELKVRLAEIHSTDREAYTDAKAEFVRAVVHRSLTSV